MSRHAPSSPLPTRHDSQSGTDDIKTVATPQTVWYPKGYDDFKMMPRALELPHPVSAE
jgi:hypothetical protein